MLTDQYMLQNRLFQTSVSMQTTLDNDFNVPDNKADVEKIIVENGHVQVQSLKIMRDKLLVKGVLAWHLLYMKSRQTGMLDHLEGELPFEEVINIDGLTEEARVQIDWEMEDLRTSIVHSRKISIRSIILLHVFASIKEEIPVIANISSDTSEVYMRKENHQISRTVVRKKDTLRIREEMALPGNKANMLEILWGDVQIRHLDMKIQDEKIILRGDAAVFALYSGEKEESPFESVEADIPWHSEMACSGLKEDMIANIRLHKTAQSLEMKQDRDGEFRTIAVEVTLEMDLEAYEEENPQIVVDAYCLDTHLVPVDAKAKTEHVLIRNQSECKINEKVRMPKEASGMLQICHSWAEVRLDRLERETDGIKAEGVVEVKILYVNVDDWRPLDVVTGMIPFNCRVETGKMPKEVRFEVQPYVDQLSTVMTDSDAAEVRLVIRLDTVVFEQQSVHVMTKIEASESADSYIESLPNMIGYVVQKEDDLFTLGKKFCTTQEAIMAVNEMEKPEIAEGERLLIMKHICIKKA